MQTFETGHCIFCSFDCRLGIGNGVHYDWVTTVNNIGMASSNGASGPGVTVLNGESTLSVYERIMGKGPVGTDRASDGSPGGDTESVNALSTRLVKFRKWLAAEAKVNVHPAICVVNGEATDGTKNAPVLLIERQPDLKAGSNSAGVGRVGVIDWVGDQTLYDRTMGCQVRVVREIKQGEVLITMPRSAMITPDIAAASDAGRAILACCQPVQGKQGELGFWDSFENTTICEGRYVTKLTGNPGKNLLVKVLQERKKAEMAFSKRLDDRMKSMVNGKPQVKYVLQKAGTLSTRAPLLAFLIHQRFSASERPAVQSTSDASKDQFDRIMHSDDGNSLMHARGVVLAAAAPGSFAPYARTLPSTISIPLCWKRAELAFLAATIAGASPLMDVASQTLQLSAEFIALLESGVLERFPDTFPDGLLTWERWIWAAAIVSSRALPVSSYIDAGNTDAFDFVPDDPLAFQSPPHIWNELGVMIPLLDMLNHEMESNQVTWEPPSKSNDVERTASQHHSARAIVRKKARKGTELFTCYGNLSNANLILQYGFAQLGNTAEDVKIGWTLGDAVGLLENPPGFDIPFEEEESYRKFLVFESSEEEEIKRWWTDDRLKLLEREAFAKSDPSVMASLRSGRKVMAIAYGDGTYHPILLSLMVVATMPKIELQKNVSTKRETVTLTRRHQYVLRTGLAYIYTQKLEKLLENISVGLKDHVNTGRLWTRVSNGGLKYMPAEGDEAGYVGWQSFFDANAYKATMEVEKHYYAMGAESCVLALLDSQLRTLQNSLDGVCNDETFLNDILQQLRDLGFGVASEMDDLTVSPTNGGSPGGEKKSRSRKRNKNKSSATASSGSPDRPRALKLHVGNLSFSTTPSELYDYFSNLYGKSNILECHIPVERDTGRSRGFGFVTMPEDVGNRVVDSGKKHEISGRLIKLARSNSAGTAGSGQAPITGGSTASAAAAAPTPTTMATSERCSRCGYRPKYCTCNRPSVSGVDHRSEPSARSQSASRQRHDSRDFGYHGDPRPRDGPSDQRYYDDRDRYGHDRHYERDRYGNSRPSSYRDHDDRNYGRGYDASGRGGSRDRDRPIDRRGDRYEPGESTKRSRSSSRSRELFKKKKRRRGRSRSSTPPRDK